MVFSDPLFIFAFLPLCLGLYFATPTRWRNLILVILSLCFYSVSEWRFLPWLLASTWVTYLVALGIDRWREEKWVGSLLALGVGVDLAMLGVFKYGGFAVANVSQFRQAFGFSPVAIPSILLPLGISFFTFHKISYKVDVYRGISRVRKNLVDFALYILFFPQLIAGPIIRYHTIERELVDRRFDWRDFGEGVSRFVVGLGKKVIVADVLGLAVSQIFAASPSKLPMATAWLGAIAYSFQILFDFSGYSDMAIGMAAMFGFHFPENFDSPYRSRSIREFWRRWHMSLSHWLKDYLYIPLGGSRRSTARTYLNLMVVFILCGLWHGAAWVYIVFGAVHGLAVLLERSGVIPQSRRGASRVVACLFTFLVLVGGFALFRSPSLKFAGEYLSAMAGSNGAGGSQFSVWRYLDAHVALLLVYGVAVEIFGVRLIPRSASAWLGDRADDGLWVLSKGVVFGLAIAQLFASTYHPFLYFRF